MPQDLTAWTGELGGGSAGLEGFPEEGRLELSPEGFGKLRQEEASRSGSERWGCMKGELWPGCGCRGSRRVGNMENVLAEK